MELTETPPDHQLGDAFDILGSYRRRLVLAAVSDADEAISLSALALELAATERDAEPDSVSLDERKRNEIRLHHTDIPPLSAAGLVRYDAEHNVVRSGEMPLEGEEWLEMPVIEALEAWNR